MVRFWVGVAALVLIIPACGGPALQLDADLHPVEATPVAPPALPEDVRPIQATACPAGWTAIDGKPGCEPWPRATPPCAADEARFPGMTTCQRLGTPCGADEYAADLPASGVLFVNPAAPAQGTGTRAAPLQSLRTALARASAGTVIALSRGTHVINGPLPSGVTVWGACVAQTTLSSPATVPAIAYSDSPGVSVRNLRISGQGSGARAIGAGAQLTLRDVLIDGVDGAGWSAVEGATSTGESVVVRNVRPVGTVSVGVVSTLGGTLNATRVLVTGVKGRALQVTASATVRDAVLLDTDVLTDGQTAEAIFVANATLTLERSLVQGTHGAGLVVGRGSTVEARDLAIRETSITPGASTERGQAVLVLDGALRGERLWLSSNVLAGVEVIGPDARATVRDSVIDDTRRSAQSGAGVAVSLSLGARATLERVVANGNATGGFDVLSPQSELTVTDSVVSRTETFDDLGGYALLVASGGSATVTRARFEDSGRTAVYVVGRLDASDVVVRGTRNAQAPSPPSGTGLLVARGGTATLSRWLFENNQGSGLLVGDGQVTGSDLTVRDANPQRADATASGVACLLGTATLSRVRIERAVGIGVAGYSRGRLTLSDLYVTGTRSQRCEGEGCQALPPVGVLSILQAAVRLTDFVVNDNGGFGLALDQGQLDVERGEVSDHLIGVNVRDATYDVSRLDRNVRYRRNQTRLAAEFVPLPNFPMVPALPR